MNHLHPYDHIPDDNSAAQDYCRVHIWADDPVSYEQMKQLRHALGETLKQFPWANFAIESSTTALNNAKPMHWATTEDAQ